MHTSIIDTVSQSELWQVHVFSIVYYRGVLYYAELNYAEKGIKAKLRRNFFSPVQNAEHAKLRRIAKLRRGFNVQGKNAEMVNDDFYCRTKVGTRLIGNALNKYIFGQ